MFAAHVTVAILTSLFTAITATTYFMRHEYPTAMMDMKRLPHSWMPMLGGFLAAGSLGVLIGFGIPIIGTLASIGLVLYFIGALIAHLRVGSRKLAGWAVFTVTVVTNLVLNLAYNY